MTNDRLIESFAADPTRNMRSSYFRSMNGILFIKQGDPWGRVKAWCPIFIVSEVTLFIPPSWGLLPDRGSNACWNAMTRAAESFRGRSTVISSDGAHISVPQELYQPPKLRNVPSRQCYIRDIMNHLMRPVPHSGPRSTACLEEERASEVYFAECRKIAWEFAITEAASKYAKSKKTLEIEVNRVVTCVHVSDINNDLKVLHKQVMDDDLSEAEETYNHLNECVRTLKGMMSTASQRLFHTKNASGSLRYRAIARWQDETVPQDHFTDGFAGDGIFSIQNPNIIKGWVDFSKFLTNLGIDIPRPFDEDLSLESVYRLAAFHDVSAEAYFNFKGYMDAKLLEHKIFSPYWGSTRNYQNETTETCNLYLG